jgi:hypothetical protein
MFGLLNSTKNNFTCTNLKTSPSWPNIFKIVFESVYVFDHCNKHTTNKKFFIIVFEHLSSEILNLLLFFRSKLFVY